MTAAGMWSNEFWPHGRDAQSMAFFSAPGIDRLYSGVTNSTASDGRDRPLQGHGLGREVGVVVLAVQRQVPDRDLGELEIGRRHHDQRLREDPVDRGRGQAADEVADLVRGHDASSLVEATLRSFGGRRERVAGPHARHRGVEATYDGPREGGRMSDHAVNAEHRAGGAGPSEHSWPGDLTTVADGVRRVRGRRRRRDHPDPQHPLRPGRAVRAADSGRTRPVRGIRTPVPATRLPAAARRERRALRRPAARGRPRRGLPATLAHAPVGLDRRTPARHGLGPRRLLRVGSRRPRRLRPEGARARAGGHGRHGDVPARRARVPRRRRTGRSARQPRPARHHRGAAVGAGRASAGSAAIPSG